MLAEHLNGWPVITCPLDGCPHFHPFDPHAVRSGNIRHVSNSTAASLSLKTDGFFQLTALPNESSMNQRHYRLLGFSTSGCLVKHRGSGARLVAKCSARSWVKFHADCRAHVVAEHAEMAGAEPIDRRPLVKDKVWQSLSLSLSRRTSTTTTQLSRSCLPKRQGNTAIPNPGRWVKRWQSLVFI